MIISGLEANKMHFKTHCFVYKQNETGLFNYLVLQSRHLIGLFSRIYKGDFHKDVTYHQHPLFVNN